MPHKASWVTVKAGTDNCSGKLRHGHVVFTHDTQVHVKIDTV